MNISPMITVEKSFELFIETLSRLDENKQEGNRLFSPFTINHGYHS